MRRREGKERNSWRQGKGGKEREKREGEGGRELVETTSFPWLISNVTDNETGRPLAEGKIRHIIEWWGRKIGLARTTDINAY